MFIVYASKTPGEKSRGSDMGGCTFVGGRVTKKRALAFLEECERTLGRPCWCYDHARETWVNGNPETDAHRPAGSGIAGAACLQDRKAEWAGGYPF